MKRLVILAFLAAGAAAPAAAQQHATDRGVWQLSGTVGFDHSDIAATGGSQHSWTVDLLPTVGYFVTRGLAVELALGGTYGHSSFDSSLIDEAQTTGWSIGPGLTYYFRRAPAQLHPYVGGRLFVGSTKITLTDPTFGKMTSDFDNHGWDVNAGVLWLLSRNAGVSAQAYYSNIHSSYSSGSSDQHSLGLQVGLSVFLY